MGPMPLPELPQVPGREVAGAVDAVGEGVDAGWAGRRVVAHLGPASGGYSERAVVAADAVHAIPDGVSDEVAVAMIGTGRTATGILDVAAISAGALVARGCGARERVGQGSRPSVGEWSILVVLRPKGSTGRPTALCTR
jgi:NADPH:quinone reductase-like Zn-dependent oxidoreductase